MRSLSLHSTAPDSFDLPLLFITSFFGPSFAIPTRFLSFISRANYGWHLEAAWIQEELL